MSSKTDLDFALDSSENVCKSENKPDNDGSTELPEEVRLLSGHVEKWVNTTFL